MRFAALVWFVLAACSDDAPKECTPQQSQLPTSGTYADPAVPQLSDQCVTGGLRELPGRWFIADPDQFFLFEYPRFDGDCDNGMHRWGLRNDDHDDSDDNQTTLHTWTDGTRYYERSRSVFNGQEFVRATVLCMLPDETLAVTYLRYDPDRGERVFSATGTQFGLKDETARGLELVGEVGPSTGVGIFGLNLVVDGNYAYVVGLGGFDVVDVSDPAAPTAVAHIDGRLNDVRVVHGATSTVAFASSEGGDDRTWIIDITDPAHPAFVSVIDEYSHSVQLRTVGATSELYLATYSEEVPRYDVTNPLSPVRTGAAFLPGETISGVHDLTLYEDMIYANNTEAGLVAVSVGAGLASPVELGRLHSAYSHYSWAGTVGGRELVFHGDEGMTATSDLGAFLRILDGDRSSPTYMQEIGRYQSRREVGIHNFEVHGTRAYIAYYQNGVRVVDLADPTNPVEVAHYNTWDPVLAFGGAFEGAVGIRKVGDLIYVADDLRGLIVLRETSPAATDP
jgi:hypothetical protein